MDANVALMVGRSRARNASGLMERYRQALSGRLTAEQGSSTLWIGPNQATVSEIRDALVSTADNAFLQPSIMTFASFAESMLLGTSQLVRPITGLQKRSVLERVIRAALDKDQLDYFAPVAETAGFHSQVAEWIAELKRRDIWAEKFQKQCRNRRDRELVLLYSGYERQLETCNLYDSEGRFWAAREVLQSDRSPLASELQLVIVDGFRDFTAAQYDILQLIAGRSRNLIVSLTLDPACLKAEPNSRKLLFSTPLRTLRRLQQMFPAAKVETVSSELSPESSTVACLKHLEQTLFQEQQEPCPLPQRVAKSIDQIELIAANGVQGEIEEIARRLKSLLLADTAKPDEVVVVFRSLDEGATRVADVMRDFAIPVAIDARRRLATAPIVRLVTTLLKLVDQDWPFRHLLQIVGNSCLRFFDQIGGEIQQELPRRKVDPRAAVEQIIRETQLPGGRQPLLDQLQRQADRAALQAAEDPTHANRRNALAGVAHDKLGRLAQLLAELPNTATLRQWTSAISRLLTQLGAFQTGDAQVDTKANSDLLFSGWEQLSQGLHSVELVDGWTGNAPENEHRRWSLPELLRLIATVAAELRLPNQSDTVGQVRVLSAESARSTSAKHVFLAGLSEQSYPGSPGADRLFDERDFQRLSAAENASPDLADAGVETNYGDEMLLFYDLVTLATERLTLSYPAMDDKGQTLPPSPFVTQLLQCFGKTQVPQYTMPLADAVWQHDSPSSGSELRKVALWQARQGDSQQLAQLIAHDGQQPAEAAQPGRSMLAALRTFDSRSNRDAFDRFEGLLTSDAAHQAMSKRFGPEHLWSPSQLESYAACPFRFFAEQVLSIEPLPDLTLESDVRRRGTILHQTLATLHQQLLEAREISGELEVDEDEAGILVRFQAALDSTIERLPLGGLQGVLREIERREIEAWGPLYAQQDADYRDQWSGLDELPRPSYFEVRFGPGSRSADTLADESLSTPEPYRFQMGTEQILLTGQIDRIDLGRLGDVTVFNIIDYKSGKKVNLSEADMHSGRQLQLPLYALAAEEMLLAEQGAVPLSAGYWSIQGTGFDAKRGKGSTLAIHEVEKGNLHTSNQWDELRPQMVETVRRLVTGVRQGHFPVYNDDMHCTEWCPLRTTCRIAHVRSLEKVWVEDPKPTEDTEEKA